MRKILIAKNDYTIVVNGSTTTIKKGDIINVGARQYTPTENQEVLDLTAELEYDSNFTKASQTYNGTKCIKK
jgi:hypothetical protein